MSGVVNVWVHFEYMDEDINKYDSLGEPIKLTQEDIDALPSDLHQEVIDGIRFAYEASGISACAVCGKPIDDVLDDHCWGHELDCPNYEKQFMEVQDESSDYSVCECDVTYHLDCCPVCNPDIASNSDAEQGRSRV